MRRANRKSFVTWHAFVVPGAFLLAVVAAFPQERPAPTNVRSGSRSAASVVAEIPIAVERNKTIVPVAAGGATLRLILDTGMPSDGIMLFRSDKVDTGSFGRASHASLAGGGSGSPSQALVFDAATFSVGSVAFKNQRATILTGDLFKGFPTDGTIGHSLFGHYVVELDYDRNVLMLHDTATFAAEPGWESLPIYFKSNRIPWLDVMVATADDPLVRLSCYIDNASSEALELLTRDLNRFRLPANAKERYLGRGLSGDIYGQEARIARLRIGSHELTNVLVAIAPAAVRSRQENADAVLANNALRRFNLIFDYAHLKLYIRPNSHFTEAF